MKNILLLILFQACIGCYPDEKISHTVVDIDGSIIPKEEGFYEVYAEFKSSLFKKEWIDVYELLRENEKKDFPFASDFEGYLSKEASLWRLRTLSELSSNVSLYEMGDELKMKVEVYFYAEVLPGPTKHYGSLVFVKDSENGWSMRNWEMLGLPMIQFGE